LVGLMYAVVYPSASDFYTNRRLRSSFSTHFFSKTSRRRATV
jgi:hypothetical protein